MRLWLCVVLLMMSSSNASYGLSVALSVSSEVKRAYDTASPSPSFDVVSQSAPRMNGSHAVVGPSLAGWSYHCRPAINAAPFFP